MLEDTYHAMIRSIVKRDSVFNQAKQKTKKTTIEKSIALASFYTGYVYMKPEFHNQQIRHHYFNMGIGIHGLVAQRALAGIELGIVSDYIYQALISGEYLFLKKKITPFLGAGLAISNVKGVRDFFSKGYDRNWEVYIYPKAGMYIKVAEHIWLKPSFTLLSTNLVTNTNYLYHTSISLIFK